MGDGEGNSHLRRRRRRSYPTSSNNHVLLAAIALYVVAVLLCPPLEVSADPETVEGMYLEKKDGGGKAANSLRRQKSGNDFNSNPKKPPSAPSFRQGYMGFESGVSGRRAFGQVRRPRPVAKEGFNNVPPPWLRKQQHQPHDSPNQVKSNNNLNRGMQKTSAPFYTSSSSIDLKPKPTIPASTTTSPPSAAASIGTTAYRDLNQVNGALHHDQNVTPGNLDVSPPASTSGPNQLPPVDKKAATKDASSSSSDNPPRAAFLAEDKNGDGNAPAESAKGSTSSSVFTGQDRHKAIVGLVIGVAFVVIFIAMGIGLAAQCVMDKVKGQGGGGRNIFSNLRTPNEEDRTPPELRGNGGAPTFVQPKNYDIGNGIGTGSGGHMNGGCGRNGVGQVRITRTVYICLARVNTTAGNGVLGNSSRPRQSVIASYLCVDGTRLSFSEARYIARADGRTEAIYGGERRNEKRLRLRRYE